MPVAPMLVFVLRFAMFNNIKDGLLVLTGIPFALTGGHSGALALPAQRRSEARDRNLPSGVVVSNALYDDVVRLMDPD